MSAIIVDTQIWTGHVTRPNGRLRRYIEDGVVLVHPYVLCELRLGNLGPKGPALLLALATAPRAPVIAADEVYRFIDQERLARSGVGYVDVALLASASRAGLRIWTEDHALRAAARRLRVQHRTH